MLWVYIRSTSQKIGFRSQSERSVIYWCSGISNEFSRQFNFEFEEKWVLFKPFSPAYWKRYLCKQCRSRWDGSPGSTQFAFFFFFFFFLFRLKPLFASVDMLKFKNGRVHLRKPGMKGFRKNWNCRNEYEYEVSQYSGVFDQNTSHQSYCKYSDIQTSTNSVDLGKMPQGYTLFVVLPALLDISTVSPMGLLKL